MKKLAAIISLVALGVVGSAVARDELEKQASWKLLPASDVRASLAQWVDSLKPDEATKLRVETLWPPESPNDVDVLERAVNVIAAVDEDAAEIVKFCQQSKVGPELPKFKLLEDEKKPEIVRDNLRLLYGRWLAQNELYDESLEQLAQLDVAKVADPAALLFYQGIAHHRLLQKKECLPVLQKLLENEPLLPRRYLTLAQLMEADLAPLKPDSLDEVARLMDNVQRRLNLGRAGKRVRHEEDQIVQKLDKLIEELEEQAKKQQGSGSGSSGGQQPTQPMQDSQAAGGSGAGDVDQRNIGNTDNWGNMPAKEREKILQEITKDLPAHYRNVIEEYFRRLARDNR
ncbi:MAG: hypothetical protein KDB14_14510 [Planctomycetales bacterium]|nr:hypothetical protein [Planctomycetales bacterium]